MSHDHHHLQHDHSHPGGVASKVLLGALGLTVSFIAVEFIAAWFTGSLALLADAWHMVSDAGSLSLALAASLISRRPRSARKTYGYRRLEVLAALANGVLLGVAAVLIVVEAIKRLQNPSEVKGMGVVLVGIAGLAVNLSAAALLHRGAGENVNVKAALAHVLGDALGSVAAIIAGLIVLWTGDLRADPILSMVVAGLLLWGAWRLISETSHILMEGVPRGLDIVEVERLIASVPGVASVHDLHLWSITAGEPSVTAHVVLQSGDWHGVQVAESVCKALHDRFGLTHATIQPERSPPPVVQLGAAASLGSTER